MNENMLGYVLAMIVLILFSAFFSATETAFSTLNKTRLKALAEKGEKRAEQTYKLSEDYDKLLSTILIGNNIVNIATASLGTVIFVKLYGDIGATISTAVVTIVVLIFGEISPKSIAKDCPERFAMFSSPFLRVLMWLFTPLNELFSLWKKMISKLLKLEADSRMSQEELLMLVDEVQQDGSIDSNESELLRNAIEFSDQQAEDILTHRVDLEAVPLDATKEEVAELFSQSRYSRLLVYEDSIDNIVGVIHQKDFYTGTGITKKELKDIISPVVFVLKSESISSLLRTLQKNKTHIAVVLDDFGGTYGIVTMEDILEELVGDIWDEHDEVTETFREQADGSYLVDASIDLDDFVSFFDIDSDSEKASLSGWVAEQLGRIPEDGDVFRYEDLTIKVVSTDQHWASELEVRREAPVPGDEAEGD